MPRRKKSDTYCELSKEERLKVIMSEINREFKKPVIKWGADEKEKKRVPCGIPAIDNFLGGGIAIRGNFTIFYGSESVGKSTLVMHLVANSQKQGLICAYIDLEHKFTVLRAQQLGVDLGSLVLINNITTAEEAMDIVIKLCKNKVVDVLIIDSIQAMSPKGEQETKTGKEKSIEDDEMALLARKMSKFLRVCAPYVYDADVAVLLVGQTRVEGIGGFAPRQALTGGHALKHWSIITVQMRKGKQVNAPTVKVKNEEGKTEHKVVGFESVLKIEKKHIGGGSSEKEELYIPFYFETGFRPLQTVD